MLSDGAGIALIKASSIDVLQFCRLGAASRAMLFSGTPEMVVTKAGH
jgi:hypothetical protein